MPPFPAAVFLSSALLFLVQPLAARRVLPVLGGTPAVWTTSLLFFQGALLAGYAYAHAVSSRLNLRRQAALHAAVLLGALAALLFLHPPGPPAADDAPVPWLLRSLSADVGLPFFALSATASLLSSWRSRSAGTDPYPLYAASNLGSLAGLLAYPLVLEPLLPADLQRAVWTGGFVLFLVLAALCAPRGAGPPSEPPTARTAWKDRISWLLLAAAPSSLLLGVTQHLTTDLSPTPLLWVLPLALYLGSYALAFAPRPFLGGGPLLVAQSLLLIPLAFLLPWEVDLPRLVLPVALPLHLAAFFMTAWVCHARLAERRPDPAGLTEYYLFAAAGGVLGGIFNALLAPLLFRATIEYPLALAAVALLRPARAGVSPAPSGLLRLPTALLLTGGLVLFQRWLVGQKAGSLASLALAAGSAAMLAPLLHGGRVRLAAGIGALLALGAAGRDTGDEVLHRDRSFFGAHRVVRTPGGRRLLVHGSILHGAQEEGSGRRLPLTYYHRSGPCGRLFLAFASSIPGGRVGAVGLGAGSVAAYALPGQHWTFFEIDPAVERTARRFFTYLEDCPARVDVVLADGRVGLEREAPGAFGLLLLDAFSSDAVPMHLLTREAVDLAMSRLADGGIAAFHVSNRFIDLVRLLAGHAARAGLSGRVADEASLPEEEQAAGRTRSTWVLLARREADLDRFARDPAWAALPEDPGAPAWTDAHRSLLPLLKLR